MATPKKSPSKRPGQSSPSGSPAKPSMGKGKPTTTKAGQGRKSK